MSAPTPAVKTCSRCNQTGHISTWKSCPERLRLEAVERRKAVEEAERDRALEKAVKDADAQEKIALALKAELGFVMEKVKLIREARGLVPDKECLLRIIQQTEVEIARVENESRELTRKEGSIRLECGNAWLEKGSRQRREMAELREKHRAEEEAHRVEEDRLIFEAVGDSSVKNRLIEHELRRLKNEKEHLLAFATRTIHRNAYIQPLVGAKAERTLLSRLEDSFIAEGELCPITCEPLVKGDIHITECGHPYSKAGWRQMSDAQGGVCGICRHRPDPARMVKINAEATGQPLGEIRCRTLGERERENRVREAYEAQWPGDA